ncbi:hypothetical protein TRICI_000073 [Trichomonascus ciferrii]|uniref:Uncharacterized protein n=1 Tax=Trichomonascus ciferrii TaxID=44093 RepID=A0A642VEE9_9ASCO|nr:hypothetical protein TRICI_000073 [Trichomonascus ciferrii]
MSTASKALKQGPIKDRERVRQKQEEKDRLYAEREQTREQKLRAAEYEMQKALRDKYSKVQEVSSDPHNNPPKN